MHFEKHERQLDADLPRSHLHLSTKIMLAIPKKQIRHFALLAIQQTHNKIEEETQELSPFRPGQTTLFSKKGLHNLVVLENDTFDEYTSICEQFINQSEPHSKTIYRHTELFHNKRRGEIHQIRGFVTHSVGIESRLLSGMENNVSASRKASSIEIHRTATIAKR